MKKKRRTEGRQAGRKKERTKGRKKEKAGKRTERGNGGEKEKRGRLKDYRHGTTPAFSVSIITPGLSHTFMLLA